MSDLKLPPKLDLEELKAFKGKFDAYIGQYMEWESQRESWRITYYRAEAFSQLSWLYDRALRFAAEHPDKAKEIFEFVKDLVYKPGTTERRPEWWGESTEEAVQEMVNARYIAERKFADFVTKMGWSR